MFHSNTELLIDYWRERKGLDRAPARARINPADFASLLPQIFILGRLRPGQYGFRLVGGLVADLHGGHLGATAPLRLWAPAYRASLQLALDAVCRQPEPLVIAAEGRTRAGKTLGLEITLAPLTGPKGDIDRLLGLYQPTTPAVALMGQAIDQCAAQAGYGVRLWGMNERELERVMRDFVAQRYNVLLCSTIIETGIDVASANTIVIARADKFGLAQLHQLRGRVGRSHHQAYAYLLVPDVEALTKQAAQRLEAIQQMEELGSGFYLAMHDLEIRGAGEVLGDNQSGNMMEVGFQLYNDMLAEAVRSLKAGREPDLLAPLSAVTEINLHAPALLPDAYCGDVHIRLSLYKRLASAQRAEQIDAMLEEITDRFGRLPAQGQTLFDVHRLRVLARTYGVTKIDAGDKVTAITFAPNPPIDALRIIELVQKNRHIKLSGNERLRIERDAPEVRDRVQLVRDVFRSLGAPKLLEAA